MVFSTCRFHSTYFGFLTLLSTELKFGLVNGIGAKAVEMLLYDPPDANRLCRAVFEDATCVNPSTTPLSEVPGAIGMLSFPVPPETVKLLTFGKLVMKRSARNPG